MRAGVGTFVDLGQDFTQTRLRIALGSKFSLPTELSLGIPVHDRPGLPRTDGFDEVTALGSWLLL